MKPKVKFARADQSLRTRGSKYPTTVHVGEAWYADHPLVVDHPDSFSDEPPLIHPRNWTPPVEQASAAPGEKRANRRGG
jgi:hypothetical protein